MIVGIDLGTTNSAVACWRDGAAILIPNAIGDLLTPSAVGIANDGSILVGMAARERQATHPDRTATAFKRYMGTRQTAALAGRTFTAEELSALVLASLKADAEAHMGEPVTGAVITVPAYFNDRQRKATRRAGEIAGLPVERLLNEPTAAALAYGLQDRGEKEPFLIFDLGGGTFDVSIVEMFSGIVEVRSSAGDNRLGGEDFNEAVVEAAMPRLDPAGRLTRLDAVSRRSLLREAAERCRRALTDADEAPFAVTIGDTRLETVVTTTAFEEQAAALVARLREPVLRSLRDSDIRAAELSEVVLVGGATRMPLVRRAVTRMFGRFPGTAIHPDHAVALGAAAQAGLSARDGALDEIRLTDVCPFTLGVEHSVPDGRGGRRAGMFSPIIERNTPIPASRVASYSTVGDNQRFVEINVYQGESREVTGNVQLGQLRVPVPPAPAGDVELLCRFTYDTSGLLDVDVQVPRSGLERSLTILEDPEGVSAEEVARRRAGLAALKQHPRDQAVNAALLARATRCYESFTGEQREMVGQWLLAFESRLVGQDPREITSAQEQLTAALDALEGERYL